jgi:hypothetical protein
VPEQRVYKHLLPQPPTILLSHTSRPSGRRDNDDPSHQDGNNVRHPSSSFDQPSINCIICIGFHFLLHMSVVICIWCNVRGVRIPTFLTTMLISLYPSVTPSSDTSVQLHRPHKIQSFTNGLLHMIMCPVLFFSIVGWFRMQVRVSVRVSV